MNNIDILSRINSPRDVQRLTLPQLKQLAAEIREFLVENVTRTGGHLASNLGVVELTIALHRVFNLPEDKIIWDVGHQSYVHKLLTGRRGGFESLRSFGGMSGFPKTCESEYDFFNTGHSSTSVSAALGMARARDLDGGDNNIIAVLGDGAMTGGMVYEALNDSGKSKTKLIVILNDNAMSISKNVGAVSKYLRNLRSKSGYVKSKAVAEKIIDKMPIGRNVTMELLKSFKKMVKNSILPITMFEDLGYEYIGPVDGHDTERLIDILQFAKTFTRPVFVHVITKKGKGYKPAEANPQDFHGISAQGSEKSVLSPEEGIDYSDCFGRELVRLAAENEKIVAVTAAMPTGVGLDRFSEEYPKRFFDVAIAEQHAVTMAAGMAISGYIPVVPIYSSFLQRAYDQMLHDVCLQGLHVVFLADRAGIVGADGETHNGIYDIAYSAQLPNMTVLSPSSFEELRTMLGYAINVCTGPILIRYPRGNSEFKKAKARFEINKIKHIQSGSDILLLSSGRMMNTAYETMCRLNGKGLKPGLAELTTIFPLNESELSALFAQYKTVAVIEDHAEVGGIGTLIGDFIASHGLELKLMKFAFPNSGVTHGSVDELDKFYGVDPETITQKILAEQRG